MNKELKSILQNGKFTLGSKSVISDLQGEKSKLIVISNNCPEDIKSDIKGLGEFDKIPILVFDGSSLELGEFCGKPFLVAALSVTDLGKITLKSIVKEAKQ